ncbi:MAG TPA: AI-2E family transporter [Paracoccaceae bacterium]|nr:AI-2E family transporter [Paracoccaceae bacterium]
MTPPQEGDAPGPGSPPDPGLPTRVVLTAAGVGVGALVLQAASAAIGPILLAAFIAVVAWRPLEWLRAQGVPKLAAVGLVAFALLDLGGILALTASGALEEFRVSLPGYRERMVALLVPLGVWLERIGLAGLDEALPDMVDPRTLASLMRAGVSGVGDLVSGGFLVLLAVVFMLVEAGDLRARFRAACGPDADRRLSRTLDLIDAYMVIKAVMSLITAGVLFALMTALRLDFAPLMAVIAFFANFLPFVGTLVMLGPAVLLTLVQTDVATAMLVAAAVVVVNTAVGSVLEPRMTGRGLGLSTLTAFLSLILWGWILGTLGALLAAPLTAALVALLDAHPGTRPIAVLLGSKRVETEASGTG